MRTGPETSTFTYGFRSLALLAALLSSITLTRIAAASGIDESILPDIYKTTWDPGIPGGIPTDNDPVRPATVWLPAGDPYQGYSVNPALTGTANAAAFSSAFQAAINSAGAVATPTSRKIVLLKAGTYFVNPQVNSGGQVGIVVKVDNVTIRGEGAQNTNIIANGQINDYGTVILFGHRTGSSDASFNVQNVTADALKGSTTIQVASASGYAVGDVITIDHLDGPVAANGAVYINGGYLWNYDAIYFKRQPTYGWSGPSTGAPSGNVDNVTNLASSNLAAQTDVPKWRSTGQETEITAINGNTLTIKDPLNIDFPFSLSPQVWRTVPLNTASIPVGNRWCGLENLRVAGGNNQWGFPGGCIALSYMAYSWVKGVDADGERWTSDPVNHPGKYGYNIGVARSYRCVVRESFSHGATDENPGGQAYGIVLGVGTSATLVEDNISLNNDKPIVLNVTGGGNVIGYNYVDQAELWNSPGWLESAIEDCHASFTHNDLIEGNWSANLGGSTTHGNSGFHTYLRNFSNGNNSIDPKTANLRAVGVFAWMHSHAFIGNVLMGGNVYQTTPSSPNGTPIYMLGGLAPYDGSWDNGYALNHTYRDGNWDNVSNGVVWTGGSKTIPPSFYLTGKPAFFGSLTWPWVDPTGTTRVYTLPAKQRYDAKTPFGPLPAITSATTANGTVGNAFSYQLTATNSPLSFGASPLPAGLSINTSTGLISGTPSATGTISVLLRATNDNGAGTATLTLTIAGGGNQPPVITSPVSASGKVGTAFNYQITATNGPASYGATGLPAWASINATTGVISGTPTAAGSSSVTISAKNAAGTGSATLTITITANAPPTITSGPSATPNPALVGQSIAFSVGASDPDGDTLSYAWTFGDGATATTAAASHAYTAAGTYSVSIKVSDTAAHSVTGSTSVTVSATAVSPSITKQPANQTVSAGQTATFSITASGTAPLSYQWQKNGTPIAGATSASYATPATTTADNGAAFRCIVTNSAGIATSNAATLTVTTGTNSPPVLSVVTATLNAALTGQRVTFAATATDANGDPLAYSWDFGDGATGSGASAVHAYTMAGAFTATVSVSDGKSAAVTGTVSVYVTPAFSLSLNSGGSAVGRFKADANFQSGSTYATTHVVSNTAVSNPAPVAVYQSERRGNFTYTVGGLTSGATYKVRLHFAELAYSTAGQRLFNVSINGQELLSNFDIVAAAGGEFIAICKNFSVVPTDGTITVTYTGVKNSAKSSGIEVIAIKAAPAPVQGAAALPDNTITTMDDSATGDAAPSDNSDMNTPLDSIDLGTVQLGKRFKLPLSSPLDTTKSHLHWTAVNRKQLPPGVSASGTSIGGKPRKVGVYTFQLKSKSAGKGAPPGVTNSYTLTVVQ